MKKSPNSCKLDSSERYSTPTGLPILFLLKKDREMENVRRLYWPQQSVSKGSLSFAVHRPDSRLHLGLQDPLLSGCLLKLSPDHDERIYQLATSVITPYGSYCYVTMPFGLKNASATYQRCMQQCFADQIDPLDKPDQAD